MGKITIFLQIDACRYDYINHEKTQFLKSLATGGIQGVIKPTFGFEPDAAYIAGLYPDQANGGAQFWYDPMRSPFRYIPFTKLSNNLPRLPDLVIRKIITKTIGKIYRAPTFSTARIPYHLLQYFSFPMQYGMEHQKFCETDTVFDLLRSRNQRWLFHCSPNYRVDLDNVVQRAELELHPPISFAFFHIGNLDRVGHQYGPESPELKDELVKVDAGIKKIWELARKRFDEVHFLVIGDHGMMEVKRHLDIWSELKKLPVKFEKDYLMFLDSTMVRFWFFLDKAESLIVDMLDNVEGGHILSQTEKDKYHLNYSHNRFGDIIFLADPGVLIYPNFYQKDRPVKGMHGYAPETSEQQSALVIHSPKVKEAKQFEEPVDMRRVFPTLLDLLDLPIPEGIRVKSLIE